jgi:hypothetical protein
MSRKCDNCGFQNFDDSSKYCSRCGSTLAEPIKKPSTNSFNQAIDFDQIPPKKESQLGQQIRKAIKYYLLICGFAILVIFIFIFVMVSVYPPNYTPPPPTPTPTPTIDPNAFRTAIPTPIPTPTAKIPPKFSRGDIVTFDPVTSKTTSLYIVLDYELAADDYHVTFIYRNDDGSWGHWTLLSGDYYFLRHKFEDGMWVYGHIDPDKVPCGPLGKDPDSVMFCQDH